MSINGTININLLSEDNAIFYDCEKEKDRREVQEKNLNLFFFILQKFGIDAIQFNNLHLQYHEREHDVSMKFPDLLELQQVLLEEDHRSLPLSLSYLLPVKQANQYRKVMHGIELILY